MNDLETGVAIDGSVRLDGTDVYKDMNAIALRQRVGMVSSSRIHFPRAFTTTSPTARESAESRKDQNLMKSLNAAFTEVGIWAKSRIVSSRVPSVSGGCSSGSASPRTLPSHRKSS